MTTPSEPPPPPSTGGEAAIRGALEAIQHLSDALDRMHGEVRTDMQMNGNDLAALRMLVIRRRRGETVSAQDIATHLRISSASTTVLIDRLAAAGLVDRRPHPRDRRSRLIDLTARSRELFMEHFSDHLGAMRDVLGAYSDDDLHHFAAILERLSHAVAPADRPDPSQET